MCRMMIIACAAFAAALWSNAQTPANSARLTNVSVRARTGDGTATLMAGTIVRGAGTLPLLVRAIGPGLQQFGVANPVRDPLLQLYRGSTMTAQSNRLDTGVTAASSAVGAFPPLESATVGASDAGLIAEVTDGALTAHCASASGASGLALLEFYDATAAPSAGAARLVNLSARARVDTGDGVIVLGFVVAGRGELTLLLRGIGPTLAPVIGAGVLTDPAIELHGRAGLLATNDNWTAAAADQLALLRGTHETLGVVPPTSPLDATLVATVPAGSYSLVLRGAAGQTGVALAEVYAVDASEFSVATSTNAVGLTLFRELAPTKPRENLAVSPYSIQSALALAYAGAEGATRAEMARALQFPEGNAALLAGFAPLRRALEKVAEDSRVLAEQRTRAGARTDPIEWSAANRLFGQSDYGFHDSFLALMRDGFAAPLAPLDFRRAAEASRLTINGWVEEQTRQKIRDLIPSGAIAEDTRLVLVNALYLKAPWHTPFEKTATSPQPFRLTGGATVDVPTMRWSGETGYANEDGFTVVTLDYLARGLRFVVALPDDGIAIEAAAARITAAHLARWAKLGSAGTRNLSLFLPKFRLEGATLPLGRALRTLGVRQAFDEPRGSANFDRIAPRRPDEYLAMSEVFHQTFIALDEEGTEAAAATAVVIVGVTSVGPTPTVVRIDRPFLFAIQHVASGTCLFFGRVMDPR